MILSKMNVLYKLTGFVRAELNQDLLKFTWLVLYVLVRLKNLWHCQMFILRLHVVGKVIEKWGMLSYSSVTARSRCFIFSQPQLCQVSFIYVISSFSYMSYNLNLTIVVYICIVLSIILFHSNRIMFNALPTRFSCGSPPVQGDSCLNKCY